MFCSNSGLLAVIFVPRSSYIQSAHTVCTAACLDCIAVDSSWNVMAHGDAREGMWRGNWRMEWVASTLHTTSEHGVSSITTADAHTSAVSSRLKWRPRRFKWTGPFRRKTKSGFCACAITFQLASSIRLCCSDVIIREAFPHLLSMKRNIWTMNDNRTLSWNINWSVRNVVTATKSHMLIQQFFKIVMMHVISSGS